MDKPEIRLKVRKRRRPQSVATRQLHSEKLAGRMPKNLSNGAWSNARRGYFPVGGASRFFRSRWEANYALYLDFLARKGDILSWEYEPRCFMFPEVKLGIRSYRPDFGVTLPSGTTEYHEVKGWMDPASKTKLKRMAKYHPDVKMVLIDRYVYADLEKKLGRICGFFK